MAAPASAAVSLPYTITVSNLNGGSNGIDTPTFRTNSNGQLCVNMSLAMYTNQYYGGGTKTYTYRVRVMRNRALGDSEDYVFQLDSRSDGSKVCTGAGNLHANADYHYNIRKNQHEAGTELRGSGVASLS